MRAAPVLSVVVCAALFVACGADKTKAGPPPSCPTCVSSGPAIGETGAGGAGGGSEGQGGGLTASVSGDVVSVDTLGFDSASAYTLPGLISADGPGGAALTADYDGTTFSIADVATGAPWFLVTPNATDLVYPTYSRQGVPADTLSLPVLDRQVLTSIAGNAGVGLSSLQAQIVIQVSRNGTTLKGISAESDGAGVILYDLGPATYSIQDGVTGDRGMILLLNQSSGGITVYDTTKSPKQKINIDVRATPGTATFLGVELP